MPNKVFKYAMVIWRVSINKVKRFRQDFADGGRVPGAIGGGTFLNWRNKNGSVFSYSESLQNFFKINEKFILFENFKAKFAIFWKGL